MKYRLPGLCALLASSICLTALAVPPGEEVRFNNAPMGSAIFDGTVHKEEGLKCKSCHPKPFEEKPGSTVTSFADHHDEESCFACHEVSYEDEGNCMTCHSM